MIITLVLVRPNNYGPISFDAQFAGNQHTEAQSFLGPLRSWSEIFAKPSNYPKSNTCQRFFQLKKKGPTLFILRIF